jgi:hypothetical protein
VSRIFCIPQFNTRNVCYHNLGVPVTNHLVYGAGRGAFFPKSTSIDGSTTSLLPRISIDLLICTLIHGFVVERTRIK